MAMGKDLFGGARRATGPAGWRPAGSVNSRTLPRRQDGIEEVRRALVGEARVVGVVLLKARAAAGAVPTAPRNFCAMTPLIVRVPMESPQE